MAGVRVLLAAALLGFLGMSPAQPTWSRSAVSEILTRYATGDYAGAIRAIEGVEQLPVGIRAPDLPTVPDDALIDLQRAANDWIRLGTWPTGSRRRQLIAATVALEVVRARRELNGYRRLSFVRWACEIVRDHPAGSDAERLWYLTSIAVMQELSPVGLLPARRNDMTLRIARLPADRQEIAAGHLTHAIAAFPHEGRFRLTDVLTRGALTSVIPLSASRNRMDANELPVKTPPTDRDQVQRLAELLASLPVIERDLEALASEDSIRAEVELNLGYLLVRQQRWDDALAHLDRVAPSTNDAFLICISHYLRGWVFQRTGRRDDAIGEYRLALDASPGARSISTMLADQLAQAGRQAEAYSVLDAGLKRSAAAVDSRPQLLSRGGRAGAMPFVSQQLDAWDLFQHGDTRLIPTYITQLREALR